MCMENTVRGVCREIHTARVEAKCCMSLETCIHVFFIHASIGSALSDILYFLVIWLGQRDFL